jgi:hypothetical protein
MSEFLRFYVEEHVRRKRDQGEPIEPAALANEVTGRLPNYRHLKKQIAAIAVEMAAAMNSAEIVAQFVRRPKGAYLRAVRLSDQEDEAANKQPDGDDQPKTSARRKSGSRK